MSIFIAALASFIIWLGVVTIHFIKHQTIKTNHFSFSQTNYYILMSGFVISILITSLLTHSFTPLLLFIFFGIVGIVGEALYSMWWATFFGKRFWVYTEEIIFNGYTSFLNFIPWGVGGMFVILLANQLLKPYSIQQIFQYTDTWFYLIFTYFGCLVIQLAFFYFLFVRKNGHFKFHKITLLNYSLFIFPIFSVIIFFIFRYGLPFLLFTLILGILLPVAEYLFGKATQLFISRKLWSYSYAAIDNGHFTPLAILPFIVGGYWFLIFYGFALNIFR